MSERKPHIVIISTWYPPIKGVAVARIRTFTKYLDHNKYQISVITMAHQGAQENNDEEGVHVYRMPNNTFFKLPSFNKRTNKFIHYLKVIWKLIVLKISQDEYSDWRGKSLQLLRKIHDEQKIDIILSSSAPLSPHILASKFCEDNLEVNWIADLRDELSKAIGVTNDYKEKALIVESLINKTAAGFITVSKPILMDFKKLMPNVKYYEEVRNGFDHEFKTRPSYFNETFTIGYIGTFYGENKPDLFFECLKTIYDNQQLPAKYKIRFIGTPLNFNIPKVFENNLEFVDKLSYEEAVKEASNHDVNLLILNFKNRHGVYSGKLFDYISVQKPILALLNKEDVAEELIQKYQAGYIADGNSKNDIISHLQLAISNWENKTTIISNKMEVKKLHRKYQVKKLELLIDKILSEQK